MADRWQDMNQKVIAEFHSSGGHAGGPFTGMDMVLLTTTGAKSGIERTTPLVYSKDGSDVVIIASMGGAPQHPAWFLNLRANPIVTIEVGTEKYQARAVIAEGAERDRLYAQHAERMPQFNEYQKKTARVIPAIRLERVPAS